MRNNRYGIGTADNDATRASIIIIAPLFSAEKRKKIQFYPNSILMQPDFGAKSVIK